MSINREPTTLIVLGGGYKHPKDRKGLVPGREHLGLSISSKERTAAALQRVMTGDVSQVIFTGGQTAGPDWPSEAASMKQYAVTHSKGRIRQLMRDSVTEGVSKDTSRNAEYAAELAEDSERVEVLSNRLHSFRGVRLLNYFGVASNPVHSEVLLRQRSKRYRKFVGIINSNTFIALCVEAVTHTMLTLDPDSSILKYFTNKRGQTPVAAR